MAERKSYRVLKLFSAVAERRSYRLLLLLSAETEWISYRELLLELLEELCKRSSEPERDLFGDIEIYCEFVSVVTKA